MPKIAETVSRRRGGVVVDAVTPDSLADACGIEAGDKILSVNGIVIPDSLSFQFNIAMPELLMEVIKPDGECWELEIENDEGEPFGVKLAEDPIMLCRNKCVFCFVDQNPKGYRQSLLIKDEDIRLSFMYGNYSTLSSTDDAEEARIIREKISPLYVSVHATDPETRIFMLKNKNSGNILPRLQHFVENGIEFHAQIVLCPGINDGAILERTIDDLAGLYPGCLSIAVVPLGITAHRQGLTQLTAIDDDYCRRTIKHCEPIQKRLKKELGDPLVFLGDEFYLRAGITLPSKQAYRDFPQMENGIGMVRRFEDGFRSRIKRKKPPANLSATLVTGTLFGPVLTDLVTAMNAGLDTKVRVAPIRNDAFGPKLINVAGLVHGLDIFNQLRGRDLGAFVVLPHVMLKDPEDDPILIDDWTPSKLADRLGVPMVGSGNTAQDLLAVLSDWKAHVLAWPKDTDGARFAQVGSVSLDLHG